ncbi:hypothetical protein ORV05_32740 [Amycolatopsis cynarae]|uniref:Uncharacterized protein n=1 Tax=Amycolatopsis cynarae TaxID=2995223 RepID=A0ABY7AZY8_9PSEU|nr:hypothetical protein [Amycolatopsis sp. HUAS 11-8]WAL65597.1 hypothetical protein ORV05_32740 [Amycolatopsis sp. HUAS 11-8]
MRLDQDFAGSVRLYLPGGTTSGTTDFTLTAGQIGPSEMEFFSQSRCHWLAGAISCMTGWDIVGVKLCYPDTGWKLVHSAVSVPDGSVLDILGRRPNPSALVEEYQRVHGLPVSLAWRRTHEMFNNYLTGGDPSLVGDPLWWTKTDADPRVAALYQHYARLLITHAGYEVPEHCRPAPRPDTNTTAATGRPAPHHNTTNNTTGGTPVSHVDEIRAILAATNQQAENVFAALAQASQDTDQIRGQLHQVAEGSNQAAAQEALGIYAQLRESLDQVMGLVSAARTSVETYAASL